MKVTIINNQDEAGAYVANIIKDVIKDSKRPVLGLATGSSPVSTYKHLVEMYQNNELDFKDVTTYNLDEYYGIDPNHSQSYYYFMNQHLFSQVNIDPSNIHMPSGIGDVALKSQEYNQQLNTDKRDLQILGIGSNGHIAFNEPGTLFEQETHVITLDLKTREDNSRFFNTLDEVPTQAITMGLANIMDSKKIILIASGESKAWAINQLLNGPKSIDVPATILQDHPDVEIVIDQQANKKAQWK